MPLLQSGCKVIIALTNAEDGFRKQEKLEGMKEYLQEELTKRLHRDPQLEIIPVVSIDRWKRRSIIWRTILKNACPPFTK